MTMCRQMLFLIASALASLGATYPTQNFLVDAPTPQIAQQIGQAAEYYRREKAKDWLGQEMAPWPTRCALQVRVTLNGPSGATSFAFDGGRVLGQHMHIEGPLDRLLASVLPHEITHTVFAYYFRAPVPRWADEGGAVLSEDELERQRHDRLVRQVLNTPGRRIPLRRLFSLHEYPGDVMVLYAEGFSVANFLVATKGRPTFLAFVHYGMTAGWDRAAQMYYGYPSVDGLENAWIAYLRQPPVVLAQNTAPRAPATTTNRIVRQTVPGWLPNPGPTFRAQAPDDNVVAARPNPTPTFGVNGGQPPHQTPPIAVNHAPEGWQRPGSNATPAPFNPITPHPSVQLGSPQFLSASATELGAPIPPPASPVGYPR